ncbi:MAG: ABC transporter permease subunit [Chloroflexi bacterium]|jgi:ABC-2 type transport system permease protein|nr:ABC transporter permease subunit [Chloroflexota bacterium]
MLSNIFLKTLRDMRRSLIWWSAGLVIFSLYFMTFFPSIQESGEVWQDYMDNLPASAQALFGGEVDLSTIEGFLSVEVFSFFYPILLLTFAISYGAGLIGSEEESGTLDLLLATPTPRWRVVIEKFGALVVFTLVTLAACYIGFLLGGIIANIDEMDAARVLEGTLNMAPLALFFAALALAITGLRSGGRGLALGVTAGLAAFTYLIHAMASVSNVPEWLQRLSPWYYYGGNTVMREGVSAGHVALLLGLAAVLVAVAIWGLRRRDVSV